MKIPSNIVIDGSQGPEDWKGKWHPAGWASAVTKQLHTILSNEVGRAVLHEARHKTITIVPPPISDTSKKETDDKFFTSKARGHGTAKVFYLPKLYFPGSGHYLFGEKSIFHDGVRPFGRIPPTADEGLLHELVHAMRIVTGKIDRGKVATEKPDWLGRTLLPRDAYILQYDKYAEIPAIMLTNIYHAEANNDATIFKFSRRQMFLRQDHADYTPMLSPSKYLDHGLHGEAANDLRRNHEEMTWKVALAPAAFNPLRDVLIGVRPREFFDRFTAKYKTRERKEYYDIAFERMAAKVTMPVVERWQADLGRQVIPPPPVHPAFLSP